MRTLTNAEIGPRPAHAGRSEFCGSSAIAVGARVAGRRRGSTWRLRTEGSGRRELKKPLPVPKAGMPAENAGHFDVRTSPPPGLLASDGRVIMSSRPGPAPVRVLPIGAALSLSTTEDTKKPLAAAAPGLSEDAREFLQKDHALACRAAATQDKEGKLGDLDHRLASR